MSTLTSKQIRGFIDEFCPSVGYVLNFSRREFEDFVEESIDVDISDNTESNGKRLKKLLSECTDEQVTKLVNDLRAKSH
mgnify:CR=1 FL=1